MLSGYDPEPVREQDSQLLGRLPPVLHRLGPLLPDSRKCKIYKFFQCDIRCKHALVLGYLTELALIAVSIRPTTGIKPLYTTIATVTMNLIVSAAIVLLNPYVTIYISYKIPPFALSVHIPDVSTSIYVEVDSKVLLGLPFCDKAFVR